MSRAWLTTSTSVAEGWGCSVVEAAAWGVPCLALDVPGIRDSVIDGRTGWLVPRGDAVGPALTQVLSALAEENRAREIALACQDWARCFSWDRSAGLICSPVSPGAGSAGWIARRRVHRDGGSRRSVGPDRPDNIRSGLAPTRSPAQLAISRDSALLSVPAGLVGVLSYTCTLHLAHGSALWVPRTRSRHATVRM